jgi:glycosyltransferase involved in cell wall biosynthesis
VRIVIDGLPIRGENSLSIVSEHLLSAWRRLDREDELHLVIRAGVSIAIPESVTVHEVRFGRLPLVSRLRAQNVVLPRLCRSLQADVLFAILPNTAVTRLPCPRAVMAWDFRYRLRPEQFSRRTRALRRSSYAIGFRQADGVACISGRTRRDLMTCHPRLAGVPVRVTHLGADHVDEWTATPVEGPYAIAFGHFANKNVELVLNAWAELRRIASSPMLPLRIVGLPEGKRAAVQSQVAEAGLAELVSISPWLPEEGFRQQFASSSLVVFPSDFEGFGLPAVEALRLGIPVVVTPDPALLEVTGGHATLVEGEGPHALALAVQKARDTTAESIAAAQQFADSFTWANCARSLRTLLGEVTARAPVPARRGHSEFVLERIPGDGVENFAGADGGPTPHAGAVSGKVRGPDPAADATIGSPSTP